MSVYSLSEGGALLHKGASWSEGGAGQRPTIICFTNTQQQPPGGGKQPCLTLTIPLQIFLVKPLLCGALSRGLLSACFPQCLHVKRVEEVTHWWQPPGGGKQLCLRVLAHRGPVVERRTTNRPTNTKNLKASHTILTLFGRKLFGITFDGYKVFKYLYEKE